MTTSPTRSTDQDDAARMRRAQERATIARRSAFLADLARTVRAADKAGVMGDAR